MAKNAGEIITKVAAYGVAGWALENALCGDRYSALFRGQQVPFMPIYAANGVALTALTPYVDSWPVLGRGLAYAVVGSTIEYIGCQIDRQLFSMRAAPPIYGGGDALARLSDGCVNFKRSALWAGFGLIAEKFE